MIFKKDKKIFIEIIKKNIVKKGIYIDFTFGNGLHSKIILKNLPKNSTLISFENNYNNFIKNKIKSYIFNLVYSNYSNLKDLKLKQISFALIDLGFTINQIKNFLSYKKNIYLDNFKLFEKGKSIIKLININSKKKIIKVLNFFENEYLSKKIADRILKLRKKKLITTTYQIKKIIKDIKKNKHGFKNIYYKVFNSLKNYSNRSKYNINKLLNYLRHLIKSNGILLIITFNSFESKIVKKFIKSNEIYFKEHKKYKKGNSILRIFKKQ
ncbi:16S rRNA (cytosine(1402)-N(4))-methyltransferase [Candidatus Vidania fulgoroideorum]